VKKAQCVAKNLIMIMRIIAQSDRRIPSALVELDVYALRSEMSASRRLAEHEQPVLLLKRSVAFPPSKLRPANHRQKGKSRFVQPSASNNRACIVQTRRGKRRLSSLSRTTCAGCVVNETWADDIETLLNVRVQLRERRISKHFCTDFVLEDQDRDQVVGYTTAVG
jgi:hypothetical protein